MPYRWLQNLIWRKQAHEQTITDAERQLERAQRQLERAESQELAAIEVHETLDKRADENHFGESLVVIWKDYLGHAKGAG